MSVDAERADGLARLLQGSGEALIGRWVALSAAPLRSKLSEPELARECRELFDALLIALETGSRDIQSDEFAEVRDQLQELSRSRARLGFTPSETAVAVFALKQAVFEAVAERADVEGLRDTLAFSQLLDGLGLWTFECFTRAREEILLRQSEQLLELTTPVVRLWDGVLAVPLIGTLDSDRTQVVMEKLLQALVDTRAEQAIIDITGVLAVDTQVAQHLLKTVMAARLMGAECTISGIRPQIAQTIVELGIEFADITTKASLADALLHAMRRLGVDVVRANSSRAV